MHFFKRPHVIARFYESYLRDGKSLIEISNENQIPSCILARLILECYLGFEDEKK